MKYRIDPLSGSGDIDFQMFFPDWTNKHFLAVRTAAKFNSEAFIFLFWLSLRDSRGYGMCGNEIKPRMLASPGVYKH